MPPSASPPSLVRQGKHRISQVEDREDASEEKRLTQSLITNASTFSRRQVLENNIIRRHVEEFSARIQSLFVLDN